MNRIGFAAIVFIAIAGSRADAASLDARDLYRRAEAMVQSLLTPAPADREVLKPPANIDPRMALAPPKGGAMRLIAPSQPFRQR